jgi:thymidylate kinase
MTTTAHEPVYARPAAPSRRAVLAALAAAVEAIARDTDSKAAWQGADDAPEAWIDAPPATDLDIWCNAAGHAALHAVLEGLGAATVQRADAPGRLRHQSYAVETSDGLAVVDLTTGDLMVGPVLLVPASQVQTIGASSPAGGRHLQGVAGAADRFVRPLMRGRTVQGPRLAQARAEWNRSGDLERAEFIDRIRAQLGRRVADDIDATLGGTPAPPDLIRHARIALAKASLRPRSIAATWRSRRTILPARGTAGVLGLRTHGSLVVLVGTDGSGKSTVGRQLDARLSALGIETTNVYMGMARGNLPGVALARRLLGVATVAEAGPAEGMSRKATAPPPDAATGHALIRRFAAWYYAAEYGYRWWRDIRPAMRRGRVVICDRYVYDLRESPSPNSSAPRLVEFLMPRPHILILPDAPDGLIHARKPERPAHEQAAQQARFRELLHQGPARTASLTVDTSGLDQVGTDTIAPVVASVVASMHRGHVARH